MQIKPEFSFSEGESFINPEHLSKKGEYLSGAVDPIVETPQYYETAVEPYPKLTLIENYEKSRKLLTSYARNLDFFRELAIRNQDAMLQDLDADKSTPTFNYLLGKFKSLAPRLISLDSKSIITERDLILRESKIGGQAFGGKAKEQDFAFHYSSGKDWFFSRRTESGVVDEYEVWHIEVEPELIKTTVTRTSKDNTVSEAMREINHQENGIITFIAEKYYDQVMRRVYGIDPQTGKKLQ